GWARIKAWLTEVGFVEDNEESLIPQWQACIDFDVVDRLPEITTPLHVFAYDEDVQAPPQYGEEIARLVRGAELHLFPGMGRGSPAASGRAPRRALAPCAGRRRSRGPGSGRPSRSPRGRSRRSRDGCTGTGRG